MTWGTVTHVARAHEASKRGGNHDGYCLHSSLTSWEGGWFREARGEGGRREECRDGTCRIFKRGGAGGRHHLASSGDCRARHGFGTVKEGRGVDNRHSMCMGSWQQRSYRCSFTMTITREDNRCNYMILDCEATVEPVCKHAMVGKIGEPGPLWALVVGGEMWGGRWK